MSSTSSHHVAILGCGVIGLSTALAILEGQQQNPRAPQTFVTIVSKEVPDVAFLGTQRSAKRKPTAEYASVWAGAHHVSDAKTERELRHDKVTFERISKLARAKPWAKAALQPPSWGHSSVLPITGSSTETVSRSYSEPEPLVWAHQTELFERAEGSQYAGKAPYEGVLDWYPDVSISSSCQSIGAPPDHFAHTDFSSNRRSSSLSHQQLFQRASDGAAPSPRSTSTSLFTTNGFFSGSLVSEAG